MIDNNMVIDELWETPVKKCSFCHKNTSECNCDGRDDC